MNSFICEDRQFPGNICLIKTHNSRSALPLIWNLKSEKSDTKTPTRFLLHLPVGCLQRKSFSHCVSQALSWARSEEVSKYTQLSEHRLRVKKCPFRYWNREWLIRAPQRRVAGLETQQREQKSYRCCEWFFINGMSMVQPVGRWFP